MPNAALLGTLMASVITAGASAQPMAPGLYTFSPSPGDSFIGANHLSRDGRVVAGISSDGTRQQGYRWSLATGRVDIVQPDLPNFATVFGLTPDGSKTLHVRRPLGSTIANLVTRDASGTVSDLGRPSLTFGGFNSFAPANNADKVFATWGGTPQNSFIRRPYSWTQSTGWQNITPSQFVGSDWVEVRDTSDDGSTWLGWNNGFAGIPGYFLSQNSTITMLTAPTGFSAARVVAADSTGTVAVGGVRFGPTVREQPAIWVNGVGTVLPTFGDFQTAAFTDVATNGTAGVGFARNSISNLSDTPFIWTSTSGMKTLADYADDFGISLPSNITAFGQGLSISGDGTVISGSWDLGGTTSEAFVLVVPAPSSVLIFSGIIAFAARRRR